MHGEIVLLRHLIKIEFANLYLSHKSNQGSIKIAREETGLFGYGKLLMLMVN